MIEIIQQTEKNAEGKLPKNIRQIGNPEKDFRIYMEDYVYTYLHPTQLYAMGDCQPGAPFATGELLPRLLILVGEINHFSNRSCAFICGAIRVENDAFAGELPDLDDDTWRRIHKELKQYFGKSEVVGWVLDIPGNELEVTSEMEQVHRENFISPYQFFFLMDSQEREEAFYVWKSGHLSRKEGYFIYYEKNPGMQEYMISKREDTFGSGQPSEEIDDSAAKHYRAMMREKRGQGGQAYEHGTGILSYLSSLLMVIVLCTVSVLLLGGIRRMEHMEQTISVMSDALGATEEGAGEKQVSVEVVSGSVLPLEDAAQSPDMAESAQPKKDIAAALAKNGVQSQTEAAAAQQNGTAQPQEEDPLKEAEPPQTDTAGAQQDKDGTAAANPADASKKSQAAQDAVQTQTDAKGQAAPSSGAAQEEALPQGDAASQSAPSQAEDYLGQGYYIVQQGDSLRGICYKIYQDYTMIHSLCEINAIEDQDYIWVGQKIILP